MLMHENEDAETQAAHPYAAAVRGELITDAPVENYLNQHFAPLIGTMSYDERQMLRAEMRQEIQSEIAAHVELGSTREQAIQSVLRSRQATSVNSTLPVAAIGKTSVRSTSSRVSGAHSLPVALRAFAMSAFASLLVLSYAMGRNSNGSEALFLVSLMLGVFPFMAGVSLGLKRTKKPLKGLLQAQLLLYAPITVAISLLASRGILWPPNEMLIATGIYTLASTLVGSAGALTCARVKRKNLRLRRRASSSQ